MAAVKIYLLMLLIGPAVVSSVFNNYSDGDYYLDFSFYDSNNTEYDMGVASSWPDGDGPLGYSLWSGGSLLWLLLTSGTTSFMATGF